VHHDFTFETFEFLFAKMLRRSCVRWRRALPEQHLSAASVAIVPNVIIGIVKRPILLDAHIAEQRLSMALMSP
jgi:hypothetical protein